MTIASENSGGYEFNNNSATLMTIDNSGKVGIGTTNPSAALDVNGSIAVNGSVVNCSQTIPTLSDGTYVIASSARIKGTYTLSFEANDRVQTVVLLANACQYDTSTNSLSVVSNTSYQSNAVMSNFRFLLSSDHSIVYLVCDVANRAGGTWITAHFDGTGSYEPGWGGILPTSAILTGIYPFVVNLGNVLIGQASQQNTAYKLDVNGAVRAKEIVVNTTGADFVFNQSHRLPSLSYLKSYINENHHLPEIASAKEMQENGLDLGENQTKLLQKVEELTLYLIEKDKQIAALQKSQRIVMRKLKRHHIN